MPRVARCVAAIARTKTREQLFPNTSETHLVLFQQRSVTMELSSILAHFTRLDAVLITAEGRA